MRKRTTPRKNRVVILLNDSEMRAVERYQKRYKASSRSKMIREIVMKNIVKRNAENSPTLFDGMII